MLVIIFKVVFDKDGILTELNENVRHLSDWLTI